MAEPAFAAHDATAAVAHADAVWRLYDEAFGDIEEEAWAGERWEAHRTKPGFRLVTAYDGEALLGFGWSYRGERGQYWSDRLVEVLPPEVSRTWVGGHVEVVELATTASARGRGIGGRLLAMMTEDRGERRALLATSVDETDPAVRLYRSQGWTTLGLMSPDVQVMGLEPRS